MRNYKYLTVYEYKGGPLVASWTKKEGKWVQTCGRCRIWFDGTEITGSLGIVTEVKSEKMQ